MSTSILHIRVDSDLRKEAEELFAIVGLDMSSAVRMFLRQTVIRRRLPFDVVAEASAKGEKRARFVRPTLEEVAAHVREKGYTFDAEEFWSFYESNGWRVGKGAMRAWEAACVTWQKRRESDARKTAALTAHIDEKMDAREKKRETQMASRRRADNWIGCTEKQRKEFCDGLR